MKIICKIFDVAVAFLQVVMIGSLKNVDNCSQNKAFADKIQLIYYTVWTLLMSIVH